MKHKFPLLFKNNKSGLNLHKHEPKMKYRQYLHNILIHLHFRNFNNFLNLLTRQLGISEHVILMLSLWIAFAIVNNRIVTILLRTKQFVWYLISFIEAKI